VKQIFFKKTLCRRENTRHRYLTRYRHVDRYGRRFYVKQIFLEILFWHNNGTEPLTGMSSMALSAKLHIWAGRKFT